MNEKPIILSVEEVRLALANRLHIRRPVDQAALRVRLPETVTSDPMPIDLGDDIMAPPGTYPAAIAGGGAVSIYVGAQRLGVKPGGIPLRVPMAGRRHAPREHCDQTYVAYEATPRQGYRPMPDRAHITYLDDSSPLEYNRRLLGPWAPAESMPRELCGLVLWLNSAWLERVADGWEWVIDCALHERRGRAVA